MPKAGREKRNPTPLVPLAVALLLVEVYHARKMSPKGRI